MRNIKYIVIHTTATPQTAKISAILNYWKKVLGWKQVGYHIIITPDGKEHRLAEDEEITNGVAGYNSVSLHVCYIGGITKDLKPVDNRTDAQKVALKKRVQRWKELYPKARVKGHRQFPNVKKACPCFDVREEDYTE